MTGFSTGTSESVDEVVEFVLDFDFSWVELDDLAVVSGQDSEDLAEFAEDVSLGKLVVLSVD